MYDTPKKYTLLLNRGDYAALHDSLHEWLVDWFDGNGFYEIIQTADMLVALPTEGLEENFHVVHLKRPA
jgi:hypothetical protein